MPRRRQQRESTTEAEAPNSNDTPAPRRSARLVENRINYSLNRRQSNSSGNSQQPITPRVNANNQRANVRPTSQRTRPNQRANARPNQRANARPRVNRSNVRQTAPMSARAPDPYTRTFTRPVPRHAPMVARIPISSRALNYLMHASSPSNSRYPGRDGNSSSSSDDSDSSINSSESETVLTFATPTTNQNPVDYIELSSDSDDEVRAGPTRTIPEGNDSEFAIFLSRFINDSQSSLSSFTTNNSQTDAPPVRRRRLNEDVPVPAVESADSVGLNSSEFEEALRAEREFLRRSEQIKRDGRLARNQQFEAGTIGDLEYDGDSPCAICLADNPKVPFGCIFCCKCVGCQKCTKGWYKTAIRNNQDRNCPLCRHDWNSISSIKKMIAPRKSCANSCGPSSSC